MAATVTETDGVSHEGFFAAATLEDAKRRIALLRPESERLWGKMSAAQMLGHCSATMEMAVGLTFPPRRFVGRLVGPIAKRAILTQGSHFAAIRFDKSLIIHDERDFETERQRLCALLDRFQAGGPEGCTKHPQSFFGPLTPAEWAASCTSIWTIICSSSGLMSILEPRGEGMDCATEAHEREKWNQRYLEGTHGTLPPDRLLIDAFDRYIEPLFPDAGRALDIAGGTGRHAIFLAAKGWRVRLTDIAEAGIVNARKNAGSLASRIEFRVEDLTRFQGSDASYDVINVFFFLRREMFGELIKALNPGGLLIYKGYTHAQAKFGGGPTNPEYLFGENELLHAFRELRVLHYAELIRDCGQAEFVGRKV